MIIYEKQAKGQTSSGTNLFRDEQSQVTKVFVCINAPVECYIAAIDIFIKKIVFLWSMP